MKIEWKSNEAEKEIGCYVCRLLDDNGNPMSGPEIHFTDFTCPWREADLKKRLDSEPHTSRLLEETKVAYSWTYCYGISVTERYMRDEGLSLNDAKALVEEHLMQWYLDRLANARQTVKYLSRVEAFGSVKSKTAPLRFNSGAEMLKALQTHDLYNPDTNMYVFLYNEAGSVAVYDWIDREEARDLGRKAEEMGDYWGAFLGVGGEIYDDPSYEHFDPEYCTSNLAFCEEVFSQGRWYDTAGWYETNKNEPNKEKER